MLGRKCDLSSACDSEISSPGSAKIDNIDLPSASESMRYSCLPLLENSRLPTVWTTVLTRDPYLRVPICYLSAPYIKIGRTGVAKVLNVPGLCFTKKEGDRA
jgi:hypothetical protein